MNKPGIPNEGDTVKVLEVSKNDACYEDKRVIGITGIVTTVEQWKEWLFLRLIELKGFSQESITLYDAKVRILKRKK